LRTASSPSRTVMSDARYSDEARRFLAFEVPRLAAFGAGRLAGLAGFEVPRLSGFEAGRFAVLARFFPVARFGDLSFGKRPPRLRVS
jgi:hypothetical protein